MKKNEGDDDVMASLAPLAPLLAVFLAGFLFGILAALILRVIHGRTARDLAEELFRENEAERRDQIEEVTEHIKAVFGDLSLEALSRSTEEFLKLAKSRFEAERELGDRELERKKELIDRRLEEMVTKLEAVSSLMRELEKDRASKFGELADRLREVNERTADLNRTTGTLKEALSSSKARGQWGERMAEDILRMVGFEEGVNYARQRTLPGSGRRPDFTFLLPRGLTLNMDVKFPFDNYLAWLGAANDTERDKFRRSFLKDVRDRIREVASRDYIDPGQNTLDYALLFIPNEQVYSFIHEQEPGMVDEGLRQRVVFCSPVTLYAVLAVIRQAVDNFTLEQASKEMLGLFGAFSKQWKEFLKKLEHLGKQLEGAREDYESLINTRRRALDRPLERLEEIRKLGGIGTASMEETLPECSHNGDDGRISTE
ncbi:MAG: DNA recombination protein RmuC [Thermovirgaceae bacterium]|jgi:DNA recombination protein RmuC|nr:DNA recombination protein RmuC [Synergistales bacterium]MDI9393169.1 DNA recombination protein RmuC [Synergistota bacterium]MDY0178983.1 DNA recombination protein RmuC [Synergistaceae bacterium]HRW87567.1 DNA recombination protein RmuC [Thermovirgaceae bacterium]MDD3133229.1 DNA recombination protein RmuC [Synergistales bacterium]